MSPAEGIIAVAWEGDEDIDSITPAFARIGIWPVSPSAQSIEFGPAGQALNADYAFGTPVRLSSLQSDAVDEYPTVMAWLISDASLLQTSGEAAVPLSWNSGPRALHCNVNQDAQVDLCATYGIDFGPQDGIVDRTWVLAGGVRSHDAVLLSTPQGSHYLVSTDQEILDVDVGPDPAVLVPVWAVETTSHVISAIGVVDVLGDGTESLLVCSGEPGSAHEVTRIDVIGNDAEPFFHVPAPCTDLEVGDFDGDDQAELAIGSDSTVFVVELDGTVRATHLGIDDPGHDELGSGIDSADVDGDGRDDLLVGAPGTSTLYLTLEAIP